MTFVKQNWVALIAIVIAIGFGVANQMALSNLASSVGGITTGTAFQHGIQVGGAGGTAVGTPATNLANLVANSCNLIGTDSSQAASSTIAYDCAVTGVTSSFKTLAQLASSTIVGGQSYWEIVGSKASTTAGYVTVLLRNGGGAATPSVTSVGSSTAIWAWKNQ